jgi:hypothetical protein
MNEGYNLEKLGSISDEDGFCSSETKHDRRAASILKLIVLARRLQKQRSNPEK